MRIQLMQNGSKIAWTRVTEETKLLLLQAKVAVTIDCSNSSDLVKVFALDGQIIHQGNTFTPTPGVYMLRAEDCDFNLRDLEIALVVLPKE